MIIYVSRFGRGIKTINDMLKQANAGRVVNEEDIPPPVLTAAGKKPETQPPAPVTEEETPAPDPVAPPVPRRPAPPPPPPPISTQPSTAEEVPLAQPAENVEQINMLKERQGQYKRAAVQAKRAGDNVKAIQYVRIAKVSISFYKKF